MMCDFERYRTEALFIWFGVKLTFSNSIFDKSLKCSLWRSGLVHCVGWVRSTLNHLTLSHPKTNLDASAAEGFWKHRDKMRNCSKRVITSFVTMFSTVFSNYTYNYRECSHVLVDFKVFCCSIVVCGKKSSAAVVLYVGKSLLLQYCCMWEKVFCCSIVVCGKKSSAAVVLYVGKG